MSSRKLLIVEDEGLVALDLQIRLEEVGYTVTRIVDNMEDAIASVRDDRPDLALMDIRIKGKHDGIETADRLRREFDIPSIFVTALGDLGTVERAKVIEPFGYIIKPIADVDFHPQIEIALWKYAMEQKLRFSEAWLAAVLRNAGDGIVATDTHGRIVSINDSASKTLGWRADEAIQHPLAEVLSAFDEKSGLPLPTPLGFVLGGSEPSPVPTTVLLKNRLNGSFKLVEMRVSTNRDAEKLLGAILVFQDIAERRRAELQERKLERSQAISAWGAGIGQELSQVLGRIEAAIGSTQTSEMAAWLTHANFLTQQMKRLEQTDISAHQAVDLNRFLLDLREKAQAAFANREVTLTQQEQLPAIEADPQELEENLLAAMAELQRALRRKGRVRIGTQARSNARQVVLTIEDMSEQPAGADPASTPSAPKSDIPSLANVHYFMALQGGELSIIHNEIVGSMLFFRFPALAQTPFNLAATECDAGERTLSR